MSQDWSLGKLLLFQKHWEWEPSGVLGVDLFNFNLAVGQEVIEDVVFVSTVIGSILPENIENKNFSIIIKETLELFIWSSTFKLHFDILFDFSLVWWSLLHVDHSSSLSEKIIWITLWGIKCNAFVGKESSGEVIAVYDSENSLVDVEIARDVHISPGVVLGVIIRVWQLMSLEEDALWNTSVLNSWLNDVDGVIIEIVVDDAFSESEILIGILDNWLLEIGIKAQNLK